MLRVGIILVLIATAAALAWVYFPGFTSNDPEPSPPQVAAVFTAPETPALPSAVPAPASPSVAPGPAPASPDAPTAPAPTVSASAPPAPAAEFPGVWQATVRRELGARSSEFRQMEVFGQLLNAVPDEAYEREVVPVLLGSSSLDVAAESLWLDLTLRPSGMHLPLMVRIAGQGGHPLSQVAAETLEGLFGAEVARDPAKLQAAIEAYSKETLPRK